MEHKSYVNVLCREKSREIHCCNGEQDEKNKGESIGNSRISIRLSWTTAIAATDEEQAYPKNQKPNSSNGKEWSCGKTYRLHLKVIIRVKIKEVSCSKDSI